MSDLINLAAPLAGGLEYGLNIVNKYSVDMLIPCACGCGQTRNDMDKRGRFRQYIHGHLRKGQKCPEISIRQMGENNHAWRGGVRMSKGYRQILVPNHHRADKKGYVYEHIVVMENYLSGLLGEQVYITRYWVVHHVNENRADNMIENLELMTFGEHIKHHNKTRDFHRIHDPVNGRFIKA